MGEDKATLPWQGSTLIGHAVTRLRAVCTDVRILAGSADRYADLGVPVVPDLRPGEGPLAGLEAALSAATEDLVVLLGVDLPFVPVALLQQLADAGRGHDAVVPVTAEGPQPLCAAYRVSCLPAVRAALDAGERRMTSFWPRVDVLQLVDFVAPGDPAALFRNLNTPADYDAARA